MKKIFAFVLSFQIFAASVCFAAEESIEQKLADESLTAFLWVETSGEYRALCYQAYNTAKERMDEAVKKHKRKEKPLAVITDIDETLLNNIPGNQIYIGKDKSYFRKIWTQWCAAAVAEPMPGAVDCLKYAAKKKIEVFYVSNRSEKLELEGTKKNLARLGLPNVDDKHFLLKTAESSKMPRFEKVLKDYEVVIFMGDNIGDFPLNTEGKLKDERNSLVDNAQKDFGKKFIVFPNPIYGHWERALAENYQKLSPEQKENVRRNILKYWFPEE